MRPAAVDTSEPTANDEDAAGAATASTGHEIVRSDPAHPAVEVSRARVATSAEVEAVVASAREGQNQWAGTAAPRRAAVLERAAARLEADRETLTAMITAEQGKPLGDARGEVERAAATLRYHAGQALAPSGATYAPTLADAEVRTLREPIGVVAAITPWNFPVAVPTWKLAPALAHGNAVVWKPAEQAPATARRLAAALTGAGLPAGVLGLLQGGAAVGARLAEHAGIDAITFTGSVEVGRRLHVTGASRGVPVQAELGGHNAAVVLADADLDRAADHVVAGAMHATGQKCTATRRIVVERAVRDAFVERLVTRTEALVVGDGREASTDLGPLVSAEARADVLAAIGEAREAGLEVLTGGVPLDDPSLDGGHYVAPTLLELSLPLRDAAPRVWRAEVFGPVATLVAVDDAEEALAVANDTEYGLSAAVHTRGLAAARRYGARLRAGMVTVNGPTTGAELHAPFGGLGRSTVPGPREQGDAAREFFTRTRTLTVRDPGS